MEWRLLWGIVLLAAALSDAWACEFCAAPSLTLSEQVGQTDVAILCRWTSGQDEAIGEPGRSQFEVIEAIHDDLSQWSAGQLLELPIAVEARPNEQFLLVATRRDKELDWGQPQPISLAAFTYVQQAPSTAADNLERLRYFLRFLEHPDQVIANDAYGEFAKAPFHEIKLLRQDLDPVKIRHWLSVPDADRTRFGLYGLLLGLSGGPEDAEFLAHLLLQPATEYRLGIDGMFAGYLLQTGASGLDRMTAAKVGNPHVSQSEVMALITAIRFVGEYEPERIPRTELIASLHKMLPTNFIDTVIPDLARLNDWDVAPTLVQLYDAPENNHASTKRTIVRFLLTAVDVPAEEITPRQRAQAQQLLDSLRKREPEFVQATSEQVY